MQSQNYVPGLSGWKLNQESGEFEINAAKIQVGGLPSDPQLITVTAGVWSEYDLPANALERYAFIGKELMKIPDEFRESAEFTTEDISFDRDGSDVRTTLTYERPETADEVAARQPRAGVAGTRISYADGVLEISHDGVLRARLGDLQKDDHLDPFVVIGGTTYINQALIEGASIAKPKISATYVVKTQVGVGGKLHLSGFGLPGRCLCAGGYVGDPRKDK